MSDNLVSLFNKLSYHIVTKQLNEEKNYSSKKKDERYFKKCVRKVRQKGCDVLLNKSTAPPLPDPCVTDYGGNWSPIALLTDYAKGLESKSNSKYNDILMNSIKCLQEKEYDCVNELLKFLLMIKKPFAESHLQNGVASVSRSDFLQNSIDSFTGLLGEPLPCLNDDLSRESSFKRALKYEESWTKIFDSKFQVLGEYSKKNVLVPEKVSFDSLFSAKPNISSQSQSNSFVFTDFCIEKNYQSEKSIFDHNRNSCLSDNPMLDSFVDNPISHKLPSLLSFQKGTSKSSYFVRSNDQMKRKLHLLKEEELVTGGLSSEEYVYNHSDLSEDEQVIAKTSGIELKRNSNCSHSFNILYEKNVSCKSDEPSLSSNDSFLLRDKKRNRLDKNSSTKSSHSNSKEIVLGLWEHDKSILREFRPDLIGSLPSLRMITTVDFVEDVKYLLTGINSGSFQYSTEESCFNMKYGTCLSDVTPESLFHFSKEFIETGNYYVKLSKCATENGKANFETCTTISQAFWKSIFDYLELHYSMVIAIPATSNLMMLKSSVKDIHEMIVTISNICQVSKGGTLPENGQLLTYLLQTAEKINRLTVKNIVFGILQNCCSVYFKCILQPWLIRGHLEKQYNEFFVECNRQETNMKNRNYYNSFFIAYDKIPSFLVGLEESIFNCGKSIHFLKLFNLEDKFCQILEKSNYPEMKLCLSDEELDNLEKKFKKYGSMVIEKCGEGVSIKEIKREEMERERMYLDYVREFKLRQEREREAEKLREAEESAAKREMKNKSLNEEINRIRSERERKRMEEEEEVRKIEEKISRCAENEKDMIRQEKNSLLKHYAELMRSLDREMNSIEKRKRDLNDLKRSETEEEEEFLDVINDNRRVTEEKETGSGRRRRREFDAGKSVDVNYNPIRSGEKDAESISNSLTSVKTFRSFRSEEENVVSMDENSNPNSAFDSACSTEIKTNGSEGTEEFLDGSGSRREEIRKSVSQQNVASGEALKNKMKVLKSEFGIDLSLSLSRSIRSKSIEGEEGKKENFCDETSENDILKCCSDSILIKSVTSQTEITRERRESKPEGEIQLTGTESLCLKEVLNFREFELERKRECTNLENVLLEGNESESARISNSDSLNSLLTGYSEENNSERERKDAADAAAASSASRPAAATSCSSSSPLSLTNPQYRSSLVRDSEISNHKLDYGDVFQSLIQIELAENPCVELMRFQRCLRRSVLIPVSVQEKLAGEALLRHLLIGENLLSHLKSLRGFFFLNDGEFGRSLIHNTFRSLARCREPQEFFERSNLGNIVSESLNCTIHGSEPNSQNLSFKIVKMPPFLNHSSHDVLSPFELTYRVDWPLNLILTEKSLAKYKCVFRFLLKLKRIVWTLNENSLHLNWYFKNGRINRSALMGSSHYHKIQVYRHAMTQVIITLDDYIFSNGIQLPWSNFLTDLETASNIDHLYQKHVRYIKEVLLRLPSGRTVLSTAFARGTGLKTMFRCPQNSPLSALFNTHGLIQTH